MIVSKIPLVCIQEDHDEFDEGNVCYKNNLYHTYIIGNTFMSVFEIRKWRDGRIEADHYVGYFNTDYFITLAEYRQKQIEEILDGEICVYSNII